MPAHRTQSNLSILQKAPQARPTPAPTPTVTTMHHCPQRRITSSTSQSSHATQSQATTSAATQSQSHSQTTQRSQTSNSTSNDNTHPTYLRTANILSTAICPCPIPTPAYRRLSGSILSTRTCVTTTAWYTSPSSTKTVHCHSRDEATQMLLGLYNRIELRVATLHIGTNCLGC